LHFSNGIDLRKERGLMAIKAPDIDSRSAADIAGQVKDLLAIYAPQWKEFDPATGKPEGMSAALINIFARYCEIIIQRLNQVPEKNFLAFLDLLGASLQPPQPARVPLTFTLAAGSTDAAVVPAGTQAAAPPAEGEKDPVIFETERELTVTPALLTALFTREPERDLYADYGAIIAAPYPGGAPVFQGATPIEHVLYLGHDVLLGLSPIKTLRLAFTLASTVQDADARDLQWEFWDGSSWTRKSPASDGTVNLTRSGEVEFGDVEAVPVSPVNGSYKRWLRCRLATPVYPGEAKKTGMVRSVHLLAIKSLTMQAEQERSNLAMEKAFSGALAVDLTKDFYPFGEKPKYGDALYLASTDAFSHVAHVDIVVTLINPHSGSAASPPKATASADLALRWEYWNGAEWKALTVTDTTANLTENGAVNFTFPEQPSKSVFNGEERFWIRVRIVAGNYGEETRYVKDESQTGGYRIELANFAPPIVDKIELGYTLTIGNAAPEAAVALNDFTYEDITRPLNDPEQSTAPLRATQDSKPTLYYGFNPPSGRTTLPKGTMSLFNRVLAYQYEAVPQAAPAPSGAPAARLEVAWEYWNGTAWSRLTVQDDSENFTRPGIVEILPPSDFAKRSEFGKSAFWLRAVWKSGEYSVVPRLNRVLLNTTMASQATTIKNEILGSSDLSENQKFTTTRKPVLEGQQLEVREPEMPTADDQASIESDEGEDAISIVPDAAGRPQEIWVRWHEVPDFYGSGPRDRHYVIDHLSGEITFGDGVNGMIPSRGSGNLRMKQYRSGGGLAGNRAAGSVVQLKTTVPYVEKVINTEAASGGAEAETLDLLYERAPRTIRHRNRVVTVEDWEDLAMLATPETARARCVPLRNLSADPLGNTMAPGVVSVMIVPRTKDAKPLPSLELLTRIQNYLALHGAPTADAYVVGPLYLRVDVTVEIALASLEGASAVERAVRSKLAEFLHPLTGGLDRRGWDFGREPYRSDLYALIGSVQGVDHIRALALDDTAEDPTGVIKRTGRFLVYSGNHQVSLVFE
jgi:hypothetical protein